MIRPLVHCVLKNDLFLLKDEDIEKKLENNTHQPEKGKYYRIYINIYLQIENVSIHLTPRANDRTDVHVYNSNNSERQLSLLQNTRLP